MSMFSATSPFAAWPWSRVRRAPSRGNRRSETTTRRRRDTGRPAVQPTLGTEMLEPRALLAVTATLSGTTLQISLSAAGDAATLSSDGANYAVTGDGIGAPLTFAIGSVADVTVAGTAAVDGQSFTLGEGAAIGSAIIVSPDVEATTIKGGINIKSNPFANDVRLGSAAITLGNDITNVNGSVIFSGAVTLAADATVSSLFQTALAKELRFAGPVDGPHSLTTVNGQPNGHFDAAVGAKVPLAKLTTSSPAPATSISLRSVTTTGDQSYGENPTLQGAYTTGGGAFAVGRNVTLGGDTQVATAGGNVTLSGGVNGAKNLEIAAGAGSVAFARSVGSLAPLASLWITSAGGVTTNSTVKLDGSASGAKANGLSIAAGVNNVVMKASGSLIRNYTNAGIFLGGSTGSTLSGFTSRDNGVAGLQASGAFAGTTISGNSLRFNQSGAVLSGVQGLAVNGGNTISDNTVAGLSVSGNSDGTVIAGNTVANNSVGISLSDATNLEVSGKGGSGNTLSSNVNYGLFATGTCDGSVVAGNTITKNAQGIVLSAAKGLAINTGNFVTSNTFAGLAAYGDSTNTVVTGTAFLSNSIGVLLSDATNIEVSNKGGVANTLASNTNYGLSASGKAGGSVIAGNVIMQNAQGMVLTDVQGLKVDAGNSVVSNTFAGLLVSGDSAGTTVAGSAFMNNGTGILLTGAKNLVINRTGGVGNTLASNTNYGLYASGASDGTVIAGNAVVSNFIGFVLDNATGLTINGDNYAGSNTAAGLAVYGDSTGTRVTQSIYMNNGTGIQLFDAKNLQITSKGGAGNTISQNVSYGLFASGACDGTVLAGNVVTQNPQGMVLSNARGLTIDSGNSVVGNTNAGLLVAGDSTGTLVTGSAFLSNGTGILLSDATKVEISNKSGVANTISSNVDYGLFASGACDGSVIAGNVLMFNSQGIVLGGARGLTVNGGNSADSNTNAGLIVSGDSTGTTVAGNAFLNNANGVIISDASGLVFGGAGAASNTVASNSAAGVLVVGACSGTQVVGNWIGLNGLGISLSAASGLTINGSNVVAASSKGAAFVAAGDCSGTVVSDNLFTSSSYGVLLNAAQKLTVNGGNRITGNTLFGLYAAGLSTGTTVTGNVISGNGTDIDTTNASGGIFQA
jgi:mucin-19